MCIEPPRPREQPPSLPNSSAITASGGVPRAIAWPCERYVEIR